MPTAQLDVSSRNTAGKCGPPVSSCKMVRAARAGHTASRQPGQTQRDQQRRRSGRPAKLACWARSEGRWGRPGATRCKAAPPPLPQSPEVAATGDDGMHQRDRCRRRSRVTRFAPRAAASLKMVAPGRVGLSGLGLSCSARQRSSMAMHCFIRRSSVAS